MSEFWNNLQIPAPSQAWRNLPPLMQALIVFGLALFFTHLFVRDHHNGGKRFVLYGPIALVLIVYAIHLFGFF